MNAMASKAKRYRVLIGLLVILGGCSTMVDTSEFAQGPAPLRMPSPAARGKASYEDSLTGAQVFEMYCGACHWPRSLSERPFANYQNTVGHMRILCNMTGKETAKLLDFMRRFADVPRPGENEAPSPKRFFYGQPIPELRQQQAPTGSDPVGGPRLGATSEASPGVPRAGNAPQEAH